MYWQLAVVVGGEELGAVSGRAVILIYQFKIKFKFSSLCALRRSQRAGTMLAVCGVMYSHWVACGATG